MSVRPRRAVCRTQFHTKKGSVRVCTLIKREGNGVWYNTVQCALIGRGWGEGVGGWEGEQGLRTKAARQERMTARSIVTVFGRGKEKKMRKGLCVCILSNEEGHAWGAEDGRDREEAGEVVFGRPMVERMQKVHREPQGTRPWRGCACIARVPCGEANEAMTRSVAGARGEETKGGREKASACPLSSRLVFGFF